MLFPTFTAVFDCTPPPRLLRVCYQCMTVRPLPSVYQVFAGDACDDEGNCAHKKEGLLKVTVLDDNDCHPVFPVLDDFLKEVRFGEGGMWLGGFVGSRAVVRKRAPSPPPYPSPTTDFSEGAHLTSG